MHYYTISAPLTAKGVSLSVILLQDLVLDLLVLTHLRKLSRVIVQIFNYQGLLCYRSGQFSSWLLRPPQGQKLWRLAACFIVIRQSCLRMEASSVGECEVIGLECSVIVVRGKLRAVGCDCVVDVVEGRKGGRLSCVLLIGVKSD